MRLAKLIFDSSGIATGSDQNKTGTIFVRMIAAVVKRKNKGKKEVRQKIGRQEAQDLSESVSGKYGGIGLVITGTALPKPVVAAPASSKSGNIVKLGSGGDSKILPKEALNDNAHL